MDRVFEMGPAHLEKADAGSRFGLVRGCGMTLPSGCRVFTLRHIGDYSLLLILSLSWSKAALLSTGGP